MTDTPRKEWREPAVPIVPDKVVPIGLVPRKGINARQLLDMQFEPIRYVVPGFIAEGLTVLAGAPKIGKSWLSLGIAAAVAAGEPAFGSVPCEAGDVLYLALEDNPRRLQKRLRQMNLGVVPERLTFMTEWPDLDNGCVRELERWVRDTPDPRLIIIDVLAKVKGIGRGDRPQYEMDYAAAAGFQKLAGEHGVAIVLVHHTRKAEADDPFDAVSGTRGLTGAADATMVLQRATGGTHPTLYVRGRDVEEAEVAMQFDSEFGTWSVVGAAAEVAKTTERQAILTALKEAGEPMTATELAAELGKKRDNIQHLLKRLVNEGKVEAAGKGRYTPVTLFTPFTPEPETAERREVGSERPSITVHSSAPLAAPMGERSERSERFFDRDTIDDGDSIDWRVDEPGDDA